MNFKDFKVGDTVIINSDATERMIDHASYLHLGSAGVVREIGSAKDWLNICVDWGTPVHVWWVRHEALEVVTKDTMLLRKIKFMFERQPYYVKLTGKKPEQVFYPNVPAAQEDDEEEDDGNYDEEEYDGPY